MANLLLKLIACLYPDGWVGFKKDARLILLTFCVITIGAIYAKSYVDNKHVSVINRIDQEKSSYEKLSTAKTETIKSLLNGHQGVIMANFKTIKQAQNNLRKNQERIELRVWEISRQVKPN